MKSVALLDGGLGQEIYRRAMNVTSRLWSVAVMQEQPDVVTDVHADFIRAGARTLTLNTYTATPTRLAREGLGDQIAVIHQRAFEVLQRAIEITGAEIDIAGCLPPLVGSYRGQPARSFEDLKSEFDILVSLQDGADVFLIETMTNILEATAACAAAGASGKPFGVAFRLEADGRLRSGETLAQAVEAVKPFGPTAIMLNCSDPEIISQAMPELAGLFPCTGGYANAFKTVEPMAGGALVDELEARPDVSPGVYAIQVQQWLEDGAQVVGGCCEITPEHIRHLADVLDGDYELVRFSALAG
ncbi:homocysteine S-methyltransferase family protein [Marinobacter sp. F3R08]|uniref:homocysteine S-methyltransferase family protein n=1 Tax=Marinobacter sp. F3R08 TaxID=2841559 RepID=UPI001C08969B|nr:homocysteine S-methyltransferase family protein [Marinobacter sp. F3R08]MBU2953755.1 homocysteine S-methyltransferase family protein [Marinobacter sp. F3R08]